MHDGWGIALLVAGGAIGLATALLLRTRVHAVLVVTILVLCGAAVGVGAALVQDHVSTTNWIVTVVLATILVPAHVRVVLGPFGESRSST